MNEIFLPLVTEVTLSYRPKIKASHRPTITCSRDAENILRTAWSDDMEFLEEFVVLLLSKSNRVIGLFRVSRGGTCGTVVDLKIIFAAAIKAMASSVILAHNHPSGNLQPSQADIDLTRKCRDGGKLLEIAVHDHLILSPESRYYSFADEGML